MKELLRTASLSFAHSVKFALGAADIDSVVRGQALTGLLGDPFSVEVLDDSKLEEARAIVAKLEQSSRPV